MTAILDATFGFLGKFQGDCPGLLVCYSTHIPGAILKFSSCRELVQAYK